jgi:hypothetical protein
MTIRALAVILAIALLNGCTSAPTSVYDAAAAAEADAYTPREVGDPERAACSERGGSIVTRGMLGSPMCAVPYADAGKICSDKTECQGECRATRAGPGGPPIRQGDKISGRCDADTQAGFGCFSLVKDGRAAQPEICVD